MTRREGEKKNQRSPLGRRKKPCFSLFGNSFLGGHATRGKGYAWAEKFLLNAASGYKIFSAHPFPLQCGSLIVFGHDGAVGKGFCRLRQVRFPLHHAGGGLGGIPPPALPPLCFCSRGTFRHLETPPYNRSREREVKTLDFIRFTLD